MGSWNPKLVEIPAIGSLDEAASRDADVVIYNAKGGLPPLFVVRTWSQEGRYIAGIASDLAPEQPVYSIAPPRFETMEEYPATTDAWVNFALERFDLLPREMPYQIAGWSFGGVLALEVAERLACMGHGIQHVYMFDTRLPKERPNFSPKANVSIRLQKFAGYLTEYSQLPTRAERLAYARLRLNPKRQIERLAARRKKRRRKAAKRKAKLAAAEQSKVRDEIPEGQIVTSSRGERMSFLQRSIHVAYLKYPKHVSRLPVTQFWTDESYARANDDHTLGWWPYMKGWYRSVPIPGSHWTMFDDPHRAIFSRRLRQVMSQVQRDAEVYRDGLSGIS